MDFYLAEMSMLYQAVEKTKVICGIPIRKFTIGVSAEEETNEGTQEEGTAQSHPPSWLGAVPCASEHRRNPPPVGEFDFHWAVVD